MSVSGHRAKNWREAVSNVIWVTFLVALIGVSVGASLHTRSSFFDGTELVRSLDALPYYLNFRPDAAFFDLDVEDPSIDSVEELKEDADLIALITSTGNRESAQYAIVTDALVGRVLKGDARTGDVIRVLEPVRIERLSDEQIDEAQAVARGEGVRYRAFVDGNYTNGFTPLRASSDYLVFMKKVEPSSIDGFHVGEVVYTVLNSPYSRIGVGESGNVLIADDCGGRYVLAKDLGTCNLVVPDKKSAETYQTNSALLLRELFGAG